MARTDLKISMKTQSNEDIDRTLSYINPNISNEVARSLASAYAAMSTSTYVGATRIISMDVLEDYDPSAQSKEENNNG